MHDVYVCMLRRTYFLHRYSYDPNGYSKYLQIEPDSVLAKKCLMAAVCRLYMYINLKHFLAITHRQ